MDTYTGFAQLYDELMDNVPYGAWCDFVCKTLKEYGIGDGLILDLGCGTGIFTEMLASSGYDMIGVDNSEDMLQAALEKRDKSGHDILYLQQDMREFELYGTVWAIVSICDSMNYLTDPADFQKVLGLVANYLDNDGLFLFDLNSEYKYAQFLGDRTIAENREDCSFIWENDYDPATKINQYALTIYARTDDDGLYERFEELHEQRAYAIGEVKEMIASAGLTLLAVYDGYTKDAPNDRSERITFLVKRPAR